MKRATLVECPAVHGIYNIFDTKHASGQSTESCGFGTVYMENIWFAMTDNREDFFERSSVFADRNISTDTLNRVSIYASIFQALT